MILCGFKEPKIEKDEEGKGGEESEEDGVEGGYRASELAISAHSQLIIIIISCCVRSWHPAKDSWNSPAHTQGYTHAGTHRDTHILAHI